MTVLLAIDDVHAFAAAQAHAHEARIVAIDLVAHTQMLTFRIEMLDAAGHPTELAERTLRIMQRTLKTYRHHRRILLEQIGLYSPRD